MICWDMWLYNAPRNAGLVDTRKRGALRRQFVALTLPRQKIKCHERIRDARQTALRRARFLCEFLDGLGRFVQQIKHAMLYGRLDDQRGREAPGKLHDTFRSNWVFHDLQGKYKNERGNPRTFLVVS